MLTTRESISSLLSRLLSVDGTGSGLDADLIDGSHRTAFPRILHASSANTPTTVGTTPTAIWTYTVPANTLGTQNILRGQIKYSRTTGSDTSRVSIYFGGSQVSADSAAFSAGPNIVDFSVWADNSASAQRGMLVRYGNNNGYGQILTASKDSTAAQDISVMVYSSTSTTDVYTVRSVHLELITAQ